ncbi:hypothetical protein V6N13_073577 [Hibiscus sabdariffa]
MICLKEFGSTVGWVSKERMKGSFWPLFFLSSFLCSWIVFGLTPFVAGAFGAQILSPTFLPFFLSNSSSSVVNFSGFASSIPLFLTLGYSLGSISVEMRACFLAMLDVSSVLASFPPFMFV